MQFRSFAKKIFKSELDFSKLQKNYRIESLALHKLNLSKILQYYRQIEVKYAFQSKKGKTWFENELRIFIWMVFHYAFFMNKKPAQITSSEWETISQYFHKDYLTCKYFFLCIEKNRKTQWTQEEDKSIMESINKPNFTNQWTEIGKELYLSSGGTKFKKPKEIRQRWNNYLNPNVLKDKWSTDQDLILFKIVNKEGRKWALISKILKTRSEHSVKNRYTNLFKKFKSYQLNSTRFRRSELQAEFIKYSLIKAQQQKLKSSADGNLRVQFIHEEMEKSMISEGSIEEHERIIHPDDSHSATKQKAHLDNSIEASPELQLIKSPVYYTQKQDDFMSTDNLMRSFQPSYHQFLF